MILVVIIAEVVEHLGFGRTAYIVEPVRGIQHGIEHLAQVLHVLYTLTQTCGQIVVVVVTMILINVLFGQWHRHRDPVAVALTLGTEAGAHTNPVAALAILHHIAKTVIGRTCDSCIITLLRGCLVENLLQVRHLLQIHIHLCQIRFGFGTALIGELANALNRIAVARHHLGETSGIISQLGKAGSCRVNIVR